MRRKMCIYKCMLNVYKNRQTGSRNMMGPKTLPTIWGTYMKLVTKYKISAINSCWEKCAYMFNVYKNQLSRQTESRNLTGPKTLPTIWHTNMKLVTKYQISAINSCLFTGLLYPRGEKKLSYWKLFFFFSCLKVKC